MEVGGFIFLMVLFFLAIIPRWPWVSIVGLGILAALGCLYGAACGIEWWRVDRKH